MTRHHAIDSRGDRIFDAVIYLIVSSAILIALYPLIYVMSASVSNPTAVNMGQVVLLPKGLNLNGYKLVFQYQRVWVGYANSLFYAVAGTAITLTLTFCAAYALSRKSLPGRNLFMLFFSFTMFFGGGLIPTYLVVKQLSLLDSRAVLLILGCVSVMNLIIMRTFIQSSIPYELQESAFIDGCSDFRILCRIILPLSGPILAVIALYSVVGQWNSYFNALIYISSPGKQPLQIVLRAILIQNQTVDMTTTDEMIAQEERAQIAQVMKYSLIVISSLPVLIMYPFVQKFFVKGVMIGAIKG